MTDTFVTVAGKPTITKDPSAVLDYPIDFTAWLAAAADSIVSVTFPNTVGVSVTSSSFAGGKIVVVWVSGGTVGSPASVTVRITTAGGRTDDRTIYFKIKER